MRSLFLLALAFSLYATPAHAGVVVTVWTPGVVVFDPYDPMFVPGPRVGYVWISGSYDEFGYFTPGYWAPVAPNPGYIWAWGYWTGKVYHEGYWRPEVRVGQAFIPGYYVRGIYSPSRWVPESAATEAHARVRAHVAANEPPRERSNATPATKAKPAPAKAKPAPAKPAPAKPAPKREEKDKKKK